MLEKSENIEKEYLLISLNSIYSDIVSKKYYEKIITSFYTLYKYPNHIDIYIGNNTNDLAIESIINKINELKPLEILIMQKNNKFKKVLSYEDKKPYVIKKDENFDKLIKPHTLIKLHLGTVYI